MRSIHFVGGDKGGVGKTAFSRLMCQWCVDQSVTLAIFDADTSQRALKRTFPYLAQEVDLSVFASADKIVDQALLTEGHVVVDLPAKSLRILFRWLEQSDVVSMAREHDVRIIFWNLTDGGFDSVTTLRAQLPQLRVFSELVVVRNRRWSTDFSALDAELKKTEAQELSIIDLPQLDPSVMYKLEDESAMLGLTSQTEHASALLRPMQQQRVTRWLRDAYPEIAKVLSSKAAETPAVDTQAAETPTVDTPPKDTLGSAQAEPPSQRPRLAVGSTWVDGARTWTEVGDGFQVHHVRCP